ncbi:MBL fold metallo-hydrolase [bacterium]|nr:MAG: MBL fold metallo-hydrolase [bacterium]
MKRLLLTLALVGFGGAAHALPNPTEVIPAQGGPIRITPIYHGSLQIEYKGKVIQVDPFSAGDYSGAKKADLILITHTHADHFDAKAIARVRKKDTFFVVPLGYYDLTKKDKTIPNDGEQNLDVWDSWQRASVRGFELESVPSYNVVRGPKPGQKFHPMGQFNGYVLTLGGKRIYIAGDTEATPEMKRLKKIDIAFLPMNLPFTMTPQEAAAGATAFKPKVVYPYHYRYPFTKANNNPQQFAKALEGTGIQVRLRNWYGHPAK